MLHRIRLAMQDGSIEKFSGRVEADETFIGGERGTCTLTESQTRAKGRGGIGKVAVMGLLERNSPERASRVRLRVVRNIRRPGLQREIKNEVVKGSELYTDALRSYSGLEKNTFTT